MASVDLSEFEQLAHQQTTQRRPCKVGVALDGVEGADHGNVTAALAAPKEQIPTGAIAKWFASRGHRVPLSSVTHHRAGNCTCGNG